VRSRTKFSTVVRRQKRSTWIGVALATWLCTAAARADDLVLYDINPGTGPAAIASGSFTFDFTTDIISSWDISVVNGGHTTVFQNVVGESSSYSFGASAYDAHFSLGGGSNYLDLYFASPGLGAIASGPATVALLAKSNENLGGVKAQIDNPSVSAVPEPATLASLVFGLSLTGWALRRRAESGVASDAALPFAA